MYLPLKTNKKQNQNQPTPPTKNPRLATQSTAMPQEESVNRASANLGMTIALSI